jgi:hypothetical protein
MPQYNVSISLGAKATGANVAVDASSSLSDGQTIFLNPGNHALHWIFFGPPGATLSVALTPVGGGSPVSAQDTVPPSEYSEAFVEKFTV